MKQVARRVDIYREFSLKSVSFKDYSLIIVFFRALTEFMFVYL